MLFSSSVNVLHFCHVMMSSVFQFFLQLVHLKNKRYLKVCVNVGALDIVMLYSDRCRGTQKPQREQEYNKSAHALPQDMSKVARNLTTADFNKRQEASPHSSCQLCHSFRRELLIRALLTLLLKEA